MKIDIMQRGMGAMSGFGTADESMESDSSILEAAIDQSLVSCIGQAIRASTTKAIFADQMADDENEISARTESTAADGLSSSRSYTASPTPASRVPGHGHLIDGLQRSKLCSDVHELPSLPSVRFQIPRVLKEPTSPSEPFLTEEEDVDMEAVSSTRSGESQRSPASSSSPGLVAESSEVSSNRNSKSAAGEATAEQEQQAISDGVQNLVSSSRAEMLADDNANGSSASEASDVDSQEDSESEEDSEDDSESEEEDELDESQEDSSFEVDGEAATESSEEEEPAPRKPSRRRSSAAAATSAKARKSVVKAEPAIVEEQEQEDLPPSKKSTRQSRRQPANPTKDKAPNMSPAPPSARTPLAESKAQEIVVPVENMADLELSELSESPAKPKKPEPIKKKKRLVARVTRAGSGKRVADTLLNLPTTEN